jgi:2-phospho-L-lactate guanylyltransferase (CobY/MobA/RfbA family)
VAPDRRGTGTNALIASAEEVEFRFGEGSCARHLMLAAERGWTAAVVSHPQLALDLDTPEDLAAWRADAIVRA